MKKILFADDEIERDNLTLDWECRRLKVALDERGIEHTIDIAADGEETDNVLKNNRYDGIILDIMMPAGTSPPAFLEDVPRYLVGLKIAEKMVQGEYKANNNARVVFLTATAVAEVLDRLQQITKENSRFDLLERPIPMKRVVGSLFREGE